MHRGRRYKIQSMNAPPAFASVTGCYRYNSSNLGAYAKPSSARYSTRALSITLITIVKQLDRIELEPSKTQNKQNDTVVEVPIEKIQEISSEEGCEEIPNSKEKQQKTVGESKAPGNELKAKIHDTREQFVPSLSLGTLAGNGVVTVKRTVHGYKKLSLVNRLEVSKDNPISKHEIVFQMH